MGGLRRTCCPQLRQHNAFQSSRHIVSGHDPGDLGEPVIAGREGSRSPTEIPSARPPPLSAPPSHVSLPPLLPLSPSPFLSLVLGRKEPFIVFLLSSRSNPALLCLDHTYLAG